MRKDYGVINTVENKIIMDIKSIYVAELDDRESFVFNIKNDSYFGYVVVTGGTMTIRTHNSYSIDILQGEVVFVWGGDLDSYSMYGNQARCTWIWFSADKLVIPLMKPFKREFSEKDQAKIEQCIRLLRRQNAYDLMRANMIFADYLLDGLERMSAQEKEAGHYRVNIIKSIDYIKENINDLPPIEKLATMAGMSLDQYRKYFKHYTGEYPAKYISMKLLQCVREYLIYSDLSIFQISEMLGFCNPYYMSNRFKKQYGISPREYRKRYSK